MIRPIQLIRLMRINKTLIQYGLRPSLVGTKSTSLRALSYLNPWRFTDKEASRGAVIRKALEKLGPIFVKFGQLLSTRQDLLPKDIIEELAKLQDQVPPFDNKLARQLIEASLGKKIEECFATFDTKPLASASIAQVHAATLQDGSEVIVKVLRPNLIKTINNDIGLMYLGAKLAQRFWKQGRRLKPVALISEFEKTLLDEMDLMREAANASQLRRNFTNSTMMYVPKIYWDFARKDVMVMERIHGIRISDVKALKDANTNMKKLAEYGVEIFFTQVLRDSFFHADMHPGNLFVDTSNPENPRYLGVDFGIMGTLSPSDQRYLAENLLAFFKRDYRKVALLHVESGWVPVDTRVDEFESAIRTVCEPIFEKPLKDISFGQLLLRLFRTAERFNMELQPQLMLLQKTLLSIEGLGRQLYPDLDLWTTAKPFLEKSIRKQYSLKDLAERTMKGLPGTLNKLLKAPPLATDIIEQVRWEQQYSKSYPTKNNPQVIARQPKKRSFLLGSGFAFAITAITTFFTTPTNHVFSWVSGSAAFVLLVVGWAIPSSPDHK